MIRQRRSIRLPGYDYTQVGAYFITLCTYQRQSLFGEIIDEEMILNPYGEIVREEWELTGLLRNKIALGEFCIMPNHFHGIIILDEPEGKEGEMEESLSTGMAESLRTGMAESLSTGTARRAPTEQFGKPVAGSIPTIVRAFKSAATKGINTLRQTPGQPAWQRNYYEHIIRDEESYAKITAYILNNPAQWVSDQLHPGEKR